MVPRARIVVVLVAVSIAGCLRAPSETPVVEDAPALEDSPFEHGWLPGTGRGTIDLTTPGGEAVQIHVQQGYPGFTGGLLPGRGEGPAVTRRPAGADEATAVWGTWDEAIWDHTRGVEYGYGWSDHFGRSPDGVPLRWLGGRVLEQGPHGLAMAAVNGASPYSVARWLLVLPDGTLLHRVRVTNAGTETVHFDLATGDDPPGAARCWADGQWLDQATALSAYELGCVGTEAGALCTAPGTPPPTRAYVADRFVARDDETAEGQPLAGRCALALGWTDLRLPAGQSFEVMFAMGPTAAGEAPAGPTVNEQDWQRLASLRDLHPEASVHDRLRLASLAAGIEVLPADGEVEVTATYQLQNTGPDPMTRSVYVPFAVDEAHPFPHEVEVSAGEHVALADGVLFGVTVEGHAEATVTLRYRQQVTGRSATFVATGARVWGHPLDTAELRVSGPPGFALVDSSYELTGPTEADGEIAYSTSLLRPFPERDLVVRW